MLSKYHVPTGLGFSPKASGFYPFDDATALAGEGGVGDVVWLIQASASNHKPKGRFFWFTFCKPKGRFFWFTFGICMVRIRYANQKSLCLQWKCGLGLEMALSVDARRGSAPCRWAFPGVLFIIKKCWNEILVILKKK